MFGQEVKGVYTFPVINSLRILKKNFQELPSWYNACIILDPPPPVKG